MRSGKWIALSSKLSETGWQGSTDYRTLRKQYFAGRARMFETREEEGDRTIFFYEANGQLWTEEQK